MADLKAFAEQLVNLTVKEVNELAQILKSEYGIEPAAAAVAAAGAAAGAAPAAARASGRRPRRVVAGDRAGGAGDSGPLPDQPVDAADPRHHNRYRQPAAVRRRAAAACRRP